MHYEDCSCFKCIEMVYFENALLRILHEVEWNVFIEKFMLKMLYETELRGFDIFNDFVWISINFQSIKTC